MRSYRPSLSIRKVQPRGRRPRCERRFLRAYPRPPGDRARAGRGRCSAPTGRAPALELSALRDPEPRLATQHGPVPRRLAAPPRAALWPRPCAASRAHAGRSKAPLTTASPRRSTSRPRRPGDRDLRRPAARELAAPAGRAVGVVMVTLPLDVENLLARLPDEPGERIGPGTAIGHVHLKVADVDAAERFYTALGFEQQARLPSAAFVSAGGLPPSHRAELLAERRRRGRSRQRTRAARCRVRGGQPRGGASPCAVARRRHGDGDARRGRSGDLAGGPRRDPAPLRGGLSRPFTKASLAQALAPASCSSSSGVSSRRSRGSGR